MKLNEQELTTILAALRVWQEIAVAGNGDIPEDIRGVYFCDIEPLSDAEIDNLCERLNIGEEDEPEKPMGEYKILAEEEGHYVPECIDDTPMTVQEALKLVQDYRTAYGPSFKIWYEKQKI